MNIVHKTRQPFVLAPERQPSASQPASQPDEIHITRSRATVHTWAVSIRIAHNWIMSRLEIAFWWHKISIEIWRVPPSNLKAPLLRYSFIIKVVHIFDIFISAVPYLMYSRLLLSCPSIGGGDGCLFPIAPLFIRRFANDNARHVLLTHSMIHRPPHREESQYVCSKGGEEKRYVCPGKDKLFSLLFSVLYLNEFISRTFDLDRLSCVDTAFVRRSSTGCEWIRE